MKSIDQAKKIYEFCIHSAQNNKMINYRDVLNHLGYDPKVGGMVIKYGLELTWIACANENLPSATAIVVNKESREPSSGYTVENWEIEAKKVFEVRNWPKSHEIDWEYIWEHRVKLSEKHGTTGYWRKRII